MEIVEGLLNKKNNTREEIDLLINRIKQNRIPNLKDNDTPQHCGLCGLFRFCKIINHRLICPWL